jgi:Ca2+-binding EF-hand superfamily protein
MDESNALYKIFKLIDFENVGFIQYTHLKEFIEKMAIDSDLPMSKEEITNSLSNIHEEFFSLGEC